ncbi:hypothetical protein C6P46_004314 [Rhodotorula mucilaginosa]|uniref:Uncharacterized protein n=1 Tax=Rhodotorula mucilaginosa TaxID=5537 RepID=A0A9P7B8N4_RHOMI|nr:hypothetical protein C6P46_004314 [Rhodotorula mucilaginosa]TKA54977.1 hypothetical protein B0A53_02450 [Rhodotorula sp. CCFEE 5036]
MADRPVLQPIIKRSHSPSQQAISNEALRSPTFIEEPPTSPSLANAAAAVATGGKHSPQTAKALAQSSYFALQPPATTAPSPSAGILLNRLDREGAASPPAAEAPVGGGGPSAALLRVASPDGSASESGASEIGQPTAPSTAPTSAAGSPVPAHSVGGVGTAQKPNLSTLFMGEPSTDAAPGKTPTTPVDPSQPGPVRRVSSPPSPHCHFAPLPRVDTERPLPRRESSTANRVKPFVPKVLPKGPERTDSILATGSTATTNAPQASSADASRDEGGLPSPQRLWHAGDSSIPSAAALSQRLSSSLTFVDAPSLSPNPSSTGATGTASPGSRPTSRRSSSSRRSRSPSPHYYNQNRDRYRNVSATSTSTAAAATGAGSEVRTQSPNLSRHASTDALSLHYIEQQRDYHHHHRDGATRSESGGRILSRTSSRAGSERDPTEASASADRSRRSSTSRVRGAPSTSSSSSAAAVGAVPFVDRDKEADLHRLETKALAGNADAERCVSPALRAHEEQQRLLAKQQQQQRERSASRGGGPSSAASAAVAHATGSDGGESKSQVLKRTNSHEEVVQIRPPSGDGGEPERGDGELEEVLEEPEEAEAEAEAEAAAGTRLAGEVDDEDEDDDEDDDEEEDDDDDDEEDEDEEEDDNEEDRSREEENDDDDEEEEEEEEPAEDRKTSLGAGVVRWHRAERDSAPPTPAIAQHQTPTTLSAPSSPPPPPPPVAGLPAVSAPTSSVSPGVAASS